MITISAFTGRFRKAEIAALAAFLAVFIVHGGASGQESGAARNLYWGDTHLHTYNSPDAFLMQNRSVSPDDAYRFAKGDPILHPYSRVKIQIGTPLDFLVVADHAEAIGVIRKIKERDPRIVDTVMGKFMLAAFESGTEYAAFNQLIASVNQQQRSGGGPPLFTDSTNAAREITLDVWEENITAAGRHYRPGAFTTLIGWEWTSTPGGANLHRVILMKEDETVARKFVPYSALQSSAPEDLWSWLEKTSEETGATFLSIPHNSNLSKGLMFDEVDTQGLPITAEYARERMRWEKVAEATQVKGDSETHPLLSPTDEFADYETYGYVLQAGESSAREGAEQGSYIRSALARGLEIEARTGVNPYKFGIIGSTDSHTGAATAEENNFWGKFGLGSTPETGETDVLAGATGNDMGAAGLAAVWAEENTRESLFEAFERKEVYSTTGPRIQVRFFGGWDFEPSDADAAELAEIGYAKGVPMGGDLANAPAGKAPTFLIHAVKDPHSANLDRIQVVKSWTGSEGLAHEKIFNVALSDGRAEKNGNVTPVKNTVDVARARYTNSVGDVQLSAVWRDSDFDAGQRAVYYVRVLEIPTPRHTLYGTVALGTEHPDRLPATIQERAYTSPIWYTPSD